MSPDAFLVREKLKARYEEDDGLESGEGCCDCGSANDDGSVCFRGGLLIEISAVVCVFVATDHGNSAAHLRVELFEAEEIDAWSSICAGVSGGESLILPVPERFPPHRPLNLGKKDVRDDGCDLLEDSESADSIDSSQGSRDMTSGEEFGT